MTVLLLFVRRCKHRHNVKLLCNDFMYDYMSSIIKANMSTLLLYINMIHWSIFLFLFSMHAHALGFFLHNYIVIMSFMLLSDVHTKKCYYHSMMSSQNSLFLSQIIALFFRFNGHFITWCSESASCFNGFVKIL